MTVATSSLASAILSFSWETQLSRSAALAALKVCLLPLEVRWNLWEPSVSGSVASACGVSWLAHCDMPAVGALGLCGSGSRLTRLMTLEGLVLSPTKRRPLPVSEAQAMLE